MRVSPERALNMEYIGEIDTLTPPTVPSDQCIVGHVYEGDSYLIGTIGVCTDLGPERHVAFGGIRYKTSYDSYRYDLHEDLHGYSFRPYKDHGPLPYEMDEITLMKWILEREIEVHQGRFERLESLGSMFAESSLWREDIEAAGYWLEILRRKSENGLLLPPKLAMIEL